MTDAAKCQSCGTPVVAGALFCSKCGVDVTVVAGAEETLAMTAAGGTPAPRVRATMRQALRDATLGEYEILDELGRGGMATVFRAHDISLDRKVAIKVMAPHLLEGEGMTERFKLEARTAAQLSHPHIIPIYAVKETESTLFFVMKYIEGRALDEIIKKTGALPIAMVRDILGKVGGALGYAHRRGVIHRDVKPGNVMIDEEGTPIVTDFGIAKVAEAQGLTMTGTTIGTPSYMSPEQCEAKPVTGASDQYSLGIVAFEMLTGKLPFEADSAVTIMYKHCHEPLPPLEDFRPDCPPEILEAVARMLAKDPADRWPTLEAALKKMGTGTLAALDPVASQLLKAAQEGDLERVAQLSTPRSPMPGVAATTSTSAAGTDAGKSRMLAAVAGIVILAAGTLAVLQPWASGEPESAAIGDDPAVAGPAANAGNDGSQPGGADAGGGLPATETGGEQVAAGGEQVAANGQPNESQAETEPAQAGPNAGGTPGRGGRGSPPPRQVRVASVDIQNLPARLEAGQNVRLAATATSRDGAAIAEAVIYSCQDHGWSACGYQWTSANPGVASVGGDGSLMAVNAGDTEITVTVGGVSTTRAVSVAAPAVATIALGQTRLALTVGDRETLRAEARGTSGSALAGRAMEWSSDNTRVASVNANGEVVAVGPGTATITAAADAARASATVTVEAARVDARTAIDAIIAEYGRAVASRDIGAVRRAFPGISSDEAGTMENTFSGVDQIQTTMTVQSVDEVGDEATAVVSSVWTFVLDGRATEARNDFTAVFRNVNGEWRFMEHRER